MTPIALKSTTSRATEILLVGAFPGYIWGWFHVPDYTSIAGWQNLYYRLWLPVIGGSGNVVIIFIIEKMV